MDNSKNNQNVSMDSMEVLSKKICNILKKKEIHSDDVVGQQLIIWLDCTEKADFSKYGSAQSLELMKAILNDGGSYKFSSIVFHMGQPAKEDGATSLGDNCPEWFTVKPYEGPEETPIEAEICACDGFKLVQDKYVLSAQDMQQKKIEQYNIGREEEIPIKGTEVVGRKNQIAFSDCKNNTGISRTLAHIKYDPSRNRFIFVPDAGGDNISIYNNDTGRRRIGEVCLQSGDQIEMINKDETSIPILAYTDNQPKISNQSGGDFTTLPIIKNSLVKEFVKQMEMQSDTQTGTLIYPIAFKILMTPEDYQQNQGIFQRWVPAILSVFYNEIRKKKRRMEIPHKTKKLAMDLWNRIWSKIAKKEYTHEEDIPEVNYIPDPKKWHFKFQACESDKGSVIKRGKPVISWNLSYPTDDETNKPVYELEGIPTIIDLKGNNVGMDNLAAVKVKWFKVYIALFDEKLKRDTNIITQALSQDHTTNETVYATIRVKKADRTLKYEMKNSRIVLSGEDSNSKDVMFIPDSGMIRNHCLIQHNGNGDFKIAAYGDTILNEKRMQLSSADDDEPNWQKLPPISNIVPGSRAILIEFEANNVNN